MKVQPSIYRPTPLHAFQHHHRRHPTNPSDWQMWIPHSTVFRKYICWSGEIHLPEANSLATPTCICHHSKATIGSNLSQCKSGNLLIFSQPLDALSQHPHMIPFKVSIRVKTTGTTHVTQQTTYVPRPPCFSGPPKALHPLLWANLLTC